MKSSKQYNFANTASINAPRSKFKRDNTHKTTFNQGDLVPIFWDATLPGDTCSLNMTALVRMLAPIVPIMDNLTLDTHWFFIPERLLSNNFKKMMGEQTNPGDSIDYTIPQVTFPIGAPPAVNSLYDYIGIPTTLDVSTSSYLVNNQIGRAYNLVYNEYYRDENLQDSKVVDLDDGPDTATDYVLLKRNKKHDYFTSCLPFAQKGDPVTLGFADTAPVIGDGNSLQLTDGTTTSSLRWSTSVSYDAGTPAGSVLGAAGLGSQAYTNALAMGVPTSGTTGLVADLSSAAAVTINTLRLAEATQVLLERDARGGSRYIESNLMHFGVRSSDSRLQRPEFLGMSTDKINVHPLAQTSATDSGTSSGTPQGNLSAFALAVSHGSGFTKSFEEHGFILGIASVRSDLTYQQGVNRFLLKRSRYDYYYPAFANLGEQTVTNEEIYVQNTAADDLAFGFQERWAEYRYKPNQISGSFRSGVAGTLDKWHLAQEFGSLPALNDAFIQENAPMSRVLAVAGEPDFQADFYFKHTWARPMPMNSIPGLAQRF